MRGICGVYVTYFCLESLFVGAFSLLCVSYLSSFTLNREYVRSGPIWRLEVPVRLKWGPQLRVLAFMVLQCIGRARSPICTKGPEAQGIIHVLGYRTRKCNSRTEPCICPGLCDCKGEQSQSCQAGEGAETGSLGRPRAGHEVTDVRSAKDLGPHLVEFSERPRLCPGVSL